MLLFKRDMATFLLLFTVPLKVGTSLYEVSNGLSHLETQKVPHRMVTLNYRRFGYQSWRFSETFRSPGNIIFCAITEFKGLYVPSVVVRCCGSHTREIIEGWYSMVID